MVQISTPETLEVGSLVGSGLDNMYLRVFEKFEGEAELHSSFISRWDGASFKLIRRFDYEVVDIALDDDGSLHVLGSIGQYLVLRDGEWVQISEGVKPEQRVSSLRLIDGASYALGTRGMFFRLERDNWQGINTGLSRAALRDLIKTENGELMFCATKGGLGRIDIDGRVNIIDANTNVNLLGLMQVSGRVLVCGARSTLFAIEDEEIEVFVDAVGPRTFFRFCAHDARVYISATNSVIEFSDGNLDQVSDIQSFRLTSIGSELFNETIDRVYMQIENQWSEFPVWLDLPERESAQIQ